ncbi:MAG TPA: heavy metal-binding domain-containing protein, partial [Patescibacteria group bacterium]|nr:heavy metal-binding domain-containing protein [Patescibacteria group bacterium]
MLDEARKIAVSRMVKDAESMGANAILNIRFASSAVMQNAAELMAYGTAVYVSEE